jgi:hypothetical protein
MQSVCAWLYCHPWLVWLNNVLPHFLVNGTFFERNATAKNSRVLIFSTTFVWNISHSKKNSARYHHGCTQVFKQSTRYSYQISMKPAYTWISSTNFPKILIYQISWKSVQCKRRRWVRTGRQAIGQTRRNQQSLFAAPNNPVLPTTSRDSENIN